ncbi:hypothetical protein M8J76_006255 [Diaphorina citri]|nr:hypothetical protein M8J76_006255 [Diaphorina citri]
MAYKHSIYLLFKLLRLTGFQEFYYKFQSEWKNKLMTVLFWTNNILGVFTLGSHIINTMTASTRYMPEFFQRLLEDVAFFEVYLEANLIRTNLKDLMQLLHHMETLFISQELEIVHKCHVKAKGIFFVAVAICGVCLMASVLETYFPVSQEELDLLAYIYDRNEPPYYQVIFVMEFYLIFMFFLMAILSVSLIPMLVTHIAGQYEILCKQIQGLGRQEICIVSDKACRRVQDLQDRESMRNIYQAHTNLIYAQSKVSYVN